MSQISSFSQTLELQNKSFFIAKPSAVRKVNQNFPSGIPCEIFCSILSGNFTLIFTSRAVKVEENKGKKEKNISTTKNCPT